MSDTADVPNDQLNQQDTNNTNKRNDLILDQGFPALNTFHLSLTKSSSCSSSPSSSSSSSSSPEGGGDNETLQLSNQEDPIPRYPFASFPSALSIPTTNNSSTSTYTSTSIMDDLLHDCQIAFTARTKDESSAYSSGSTFFIPASMKPRCALERLALDIFQSHTHDLKPGKHYDLERSGAEWWTLVLDTSSARNRTDNKDNDNDGDDDDDDDDDDDEVGMHFDADYGLEHQLPHYMVHPRVATVTYLSNVGVPTLVLNRKSPPPTDVEKKTLNGPVNKGWLSYPMIGKHIAFDGRLLHGAPGTFFPAIVMGEKEEDACGSGEKDAKKRRLNEHADMMVQESKQHHPHPQRITFLVNIWLNHCPMDAELLDDELCQQMKTTTTTTTTTGTSPSVVLWNLQKDAISNPPKLPNAVIQSAKRSKQAAGTDECVICGREVDIHYQSEMNVLHAISKDAYQVKGKSMEIEFDSNAVVLAVGAIVEDSSSDEDDDNDGSEE